MAVTTVNDTATSTTLLAPSVGNYGFSVFNTSTAILYMLQGTGTASATNFSVRLDPGDYWETPHPNWAKEGATGVWASDASGAALIATW